jgi:peptidoglycan/xylan/chitin deacetylase (PgdA/CDA1 family)
MPLSRVFKLIVSLLLAGSDAIADVVLQLFTGRTRHRLVVLYYHAVPASARQRFAAQMDQLKSLTEVVDLRRLHPHGSRRLSVVTFDDAFVSVVDNALPALRMREIPCIVFVPTGSLAGHPGWLTAEHADASEVVASADLLKTIAADPLVAIGSHSISHPNFRQLTEQQATDELSGSKTALEALLGQPVSFFSFPHGAYTPTSLEVARRCGYQRVFTIEPQQLLAHAEPFKVGRVRVNLNDWPLEFKLKAIGAYRWLAPVFELKRRFWSPRCGDRLTLAS